MLLFAKEALSDDAYLSWLTFIKGNHAPPLVYLPVYVSTCTLVYYGKKTGGHVCSVNLIGLLLLDYKYTDINHITAGERKKERDRDRKRRIAYEKS